MFTAIAIHHLHPDYVDELLAHMHLVRDSVAGVDGLVEFECMRDLETGRLLGVSRWESREAFAAALTLIGANADRRQPGGRLRMTSS